MKVFQKSILVIGLVILDKAVKLLISAKFKYKTFDFLFHLFRLRYVENTGAAFSMFSGKTAILVWLTAILIALCFLSLLFNKKSSILFNISLILITAGGAGNLIDRIFSGFVVDYIEPLFINFAVFNLADIFITVGAFLLCAHEIVDTKSK